MAMPGGGCFCRNGDANSEAGCQKWQSVTQLIAKNGKGQSK